VVSHDVVQFPSDTRSLPARDILKEGVREGSLRYVAFKNLGTNPSGNADAHSTSAQGRN
jgi:hypothetical protein